MEYSIIILTITLILQACNQGNEANDRSNIIDTTNTTTFVQQNQKPKQLLFLNISEIIADSSYSIWVNKQDSNFSLALHFQKGTLAFSYSPECWLIFPYKFEKNQLTVYWDNNIDTKYEFEIVKAVKKVEKKFIGKPFMTLQLLNDTTLSAIYLINGIRATINKSNKQRTFFPDKFYLVQEGEMYD